MRYSSLRQINTGNVERLQPAWTFRTGKPGSEAVPVVIGGVMYVTAPDGVYALVPETGELLWKFNTGAGIYASPSVYMVNGEEFVTVASGGGDRGRRGGDLILSFALPKR